ncbi:lipid A ethanolaminephosphotransferase [Pontibacter aydingkolensis]|uniref:Sulfatase-like hydrolase/transferase n=1 Tax=Pontibacter aydingkolensis TaxID=1911536 RepID=A0ABS7CPD7_9BACT|nr:sulfatase-like hydrolase/transferase [Pontibacter aydingkolensis]MBW7465689.1 sulfatase-like hydrolase/transferase [Pontibacter aydingkolensis]
MKYIKQTILAPLLLFVAMCLLAVTVEMRPGRVYYILQYILFRLSILDLLLYLAVFAVCVWSLQVLLLNKSKAVRYTFLGLLLPFLFISLSYRFITGYNYTYSDAQTALNNLSFWDAALQNYALPIFGALLAAIGVVFILAFISRKLQPVYTFKHTLNILPVILLSVWYINRTLGVVDDLPAFYRVPVSTALAATHQLPLGQREAVTVAPTSAGVKHLFLVVDESITGSSLSLNGNPVNTTPFLDSVKDSLLNFGVASAITNYSAGSNIALMSGVQTADLPDRQHLALTRPAIFQYAKEAGYTTYYIDAQLSSQALQNYLAPADLKHIDHFIQPADLDSGLPYHQRDFEVAKLLAKLSRADEKVFVYVNKVGAHWPYARTYPESGIIFTPVLPKTSMLKDRERATNTYHNAIRWTVDKFWQKLMQGISATDSTVVIYTSDHGQNLTEHGISIAHASIYKPNALEANVPLWILDKSNITSKHTLPQPNLQSHAQVFPTILLLQGYDSTFIRSKYGYTLFDAPKDSKRYFWTGDIFGRGQTDLVEFTVAPAK